MVHDSHGLHHIHKRKRIHQKHENYPHSDKWKNRIDKGVYFIGGIGLIFTIPQITKIWLNQNAAGVSVIAWISYLIGALFWVFYGFMHKERPIIFTYGVWVILDIIIIIGTIIYG